MRLLKKELIGKDTEILLVETAEMYTVSLCTLNLSAVYSNQLYCNFDDYRQARNFFDILCLLKEQE
ncbi:hypothetical protein [Enterococcus sp. 5H]|uniref:hypothetical protein n=1 Tax=Enterococcus sp. 5H TaxID=1229490 RepID=UPI002303DAC9|nr:hypothetical protein [Enterococcus sp. 5H]